MIIPPSPGNASCSSDAEVRSLSMPAESSNPFTTIASDSSSESNTFTNFSFGFRTRLRVAARITSFCHDISNSGIGPTADSGLLA